MAQVTITDGFAAVDAEPSATMEWVDTPVVQRMTLTQMRLRRLLSMGELARAAGVAQSTIFAIEHKDAQPRMSTIRKLAKALRCEPEDVLWPGNPLGLPEDNQANG